MNSTETWASQHEAEDPERAEKALPKRKRAWLGRIATIESPPSRLRKSPDDAASDESEQVRSLPAPLSRVSPEITGQSGASHEPAEDLEITDDKRLSTVPH